MKMNLNQEDQAFLKEFPLYDGVETIDIVESLGNGVIRCYSLLDYEDSHGEPYDWGHEYYEFNVVLTAKGWDVIDFWNSNPQPTLREVFKRYRSKATWA